MRKREFGWITKLIAVAVAVAATAGEPDRRESFLCIIEENDTFGDVLGGTTRDRHYTQGLKVMWIGGDGSFSKCTAALDRLVPVCGMLPKASNLGFVILGQNIYTPSDLNATAPIHNDRPYAGWLYAGLVFQREGVTPARRIPVLDSFELDLGVTGSASLAREAQRTWHDWTHGTIPRGWHNQIKTEPGLELKYARYWRLTLNEKTADFFDFIPHIGGSLGNIRTHAAAGGTLRLGWNLPRDFGPVIGDAAAPTIGRRKEAGWFSFYGFGGAEGRIVARNIFLDGNTYLSSMSVDKKNAVADLYWGAAILLWQRVELSIMGVYRTEEFRGQQNPDTFGSIMLKAAFPI
ncbi:MAG: lipid A deacylase LpxR family protein [Verrucomicrobiae bacterium]|nr:lipid A deacylase LpxR family protein [Verrucomicrobiae bacterium]